MEKFATAIDANDEQTLLALFAEDVTLTSDGGGKTPAARNVVRGSYESLMKAGKVQSEGRKGRTVRSAGGKKRAAASKSSKGAAASKSRKK